MRALVLGGVVMVGCSGGGNAAVDARPRDSTLADMMQMPDANPDAPYDASTIDAIHLCSVDMDLGNLSVGTSTSPAIGNHFDTSPVPEFYLAARLGPSMPVIDGLIIDVAEPTNGFELNVPYPNEPDANATTWIANAYILGDYDTVAGTVANLYWATTGATTFTAIGKTTGSLISGTTSTMTFEEIDQNTGEPIAGGCTTTISSLTFYFQQN